MIRATLLTLTLLGGCTFDVRVGGHSLAEEADAGTGAADAALTPRGRIVYGHAAHGLLLEGDDLIMTTEVSPDPDGNHFAVVRLSPGGGYEIIADRLVGEDIVGDADRYYVVRTDSPHSLVAIDRTAHTQTVLLANRYNLQRLGIDAEWLYVSERVTESSDEYRLIRVTKDGAREQVVFRGARNGLFGFDDQYVYMNEWPSERGVRILAVPKSGGTPIELTTIPSGRGMHVDGDWLYVAELDEEHIESNCAIVRIRRPSLPPVAAEPLVTGLGSPMFAAVRDGQLYWSAYFSGIQRAPVAGGTAETLSGCGGDDTRYPGYDRADPPPPPPSQGCSVFALGTDTIYFSARDPAGHGVVMAVDL